MTLRNKKISIPPELQSVLERLMCVFNYANDHEDIDGFISGGTLSRMLPIIKTNDWIEIVNAIVAGDRLGIAKVQFGDEYSRLPSGWTDFFYFIWDPSVPTEVVTGATKNLHHTLETYRRGNKRFEFLFIIPIPSKMPWETKIREFLRLHFNNTEWTGEHCCENRVEWDLKAIAVAEYISKRMKTDVSPIDMREKYVKGFFF